MTATAIASTTATATAPPRAAQMPLAEHAREARTRLVRVAAAFVVAAVVGYLLSDQVLDVLRAPIVEIAASQDASLNYDSVTAAFDLKLQIALYAAVVLSSPAWLYEGLAYLSPGLTRREKKYTFGFLFAALPLFAAGCTAGVLLFPHMVQLLAGFASSEDSTLLVASDYVDFVLKVVLSTGLAFTLPVFMVLANFLGLVSAHTLARGWRVCVVVIILFSALVTPAADVLSMFLVALPMTALFFTAFIITHLRDRAVARRAARTTGQTSTLQTGSV